MMDQGSENNVKVSPQIEETAPVDQEPVQQEDHEEQGPSSSFDNILPPNIKNTLGLWASWAKQKSAEIQSSEVFVNAQARTTQVVNSTVEAAAPILNSAYESVSAASVVAIETTEKLGVRAYEATASATEQMKPAIEEVYLLQ